MVPFSFSFSFGFGFGFGFGAAFRTKAEGGGKNHLILSVEFKKFFKIFWTNLPFRWYSIHIHA